jgi:hypothetical protein
VTDLTVLDAIATALQGAAEYDKNEKTAPAAVLWTDKGREWEPLLSALRARLPLLTFGDYQPQLLQGPAIWLRCMLAGAIEGSALAIDETPVIYLPGVGRDDMRAVADVAELLQPLAELQYRGVFWTHPNGRDWTVAAFLRNKDKGLGLAVKDNAETPAALKRALGVLASERVADLANRELEAADFDALLDPDSTRSLLLWLDDPAGFKQSRSVEQWAAFRSTSKKEFHFDPATDGELTAAEYLGRRAGAWAKAWERFAEAADRYPHIPDRLRQAQPQELVPEHPDSWPQANEQAESGLRGALLALERAQPDEARARLRDLEIRHGERRGWLWGRLGQATLADALQHLLQLGDATAEGWRAGDVREIAHQYAASGWRADGAVLAALAAVDGADDVQAVKTAADVLYRVWLEQAAKALQAAAEAGDWPDGFDASEVPPSSCVLFSDGLRYDLGERLKARLEALACDCELSADTAALPPITGTAKPAVSPVAGKLASGPGFDPTPVGGSSKLTAETLRKLMRDAGWQVLEPAEGGDPSGRAWTECGDIDEFGHSHGWKLAREVDAEVREIAERVERLLRYGWQRVVVVTDHGWLLVPGGLPKVDLPEHLAEQRKGRCARIKASAASDFLTLPWRWDSDVGIAFAPGISTFVAGQEYDHGGLSPQECVVPRLTVTLAGGAVPSVTIDTVAWSGLRCRVKVAGGATGLSLDLRTKAGDAGTSLAVAGKEFDEAAEAAVLVKDDDRLGEAAIVVVLSADGSLVKQQTTVVGGET